METPMNCRVLLVDDEPLILVITTDLLAGIASSVTKASNAREALTAFETGEFDLLITDRFMPGIDGLGLTRILKAKNPHLKVILISGFAGTVPLQQEGGPDTFLLKPFSREQLLQSMRQVLELTPAEAH